MSFLHLIRLILLSASIVASFSSLSQDQITATSLIDVAKGGSSKYQEAVSNYLDGKTKKIIGGTIAPINAYPWQASLGVAWIDSPHQAHFCGGSLYSDKWIVTAAHCLVNTSPKDFMVTLGTNKLGLGGSKHTVNRVIIKSDYNSKTQDNDVAIIELRNSISFSISVQPIVLISEIIEESVATPGVTVTVSGWGLTEEGGKKVADLRFVTVPLVERKVCNRPLGYDGAVTESMLCAGNTLGGEDSCQGDSGGPLTISSPTGNRLLGIVSWGQGCARPNLVGVYARISKFEKWINSCTQNPSICR